MLAGCRVAETSAVIESLSEYLGRYDARAMGQRYGSAECREKIPAKILSPRQRRWKRFHVHLLICLVKRRQIPRLIPSTYPSNFYRFIMRRTDFSLFQTHKSYTRPRNGEDQIYWNGWEKKSSFLNSTAKAQRISWKEDSYLMHIPKPSLLLSAVSTNAAESVYP